MDIQSNEISSTSQPQKIFNNLVENPNYNLPIQSNDVTTTTKNAPTSSSTLQNQQNYLIFNQQRIAEALQLRINIDQQQ